MGDGRDIDADYDEHAVTIGDRKLEAAGVPAVLVSLRRGLAEMGPVRTVEALARINQRHGFDCPGCAWPEEHGGRKLAEFCENGAKAVAEEATKRRVTPEFFARHTVAELAAKPEYWLSQQGRLTHPMVLRPGEQHYQPISWDDAYAVIAEHLNALASPDEAVFYTSGRTSNEAAFLYQLLVRSFGTNNLPDCSNMCHESSGVALTESIGIGKGSVTVLDLEHADCIVIAGQNPGTNHPRMLSVLEKAKANGDLKQAAQALGLTWKSVPEFKRSGAVEGLGAGSQVMDAFTKPIGSVFGPVPVGEARFVCKVVGRTLPDPAKLAEEREMLIGELKHSKALERYALFAEGVRAELVRKGKIKIHQKVVDRIVASYRQS